MGVQPPFSNAFGLDYNTYPWLFLAISLVINGGPVGHSEPHLECSDWQDDASHTGRHRLS